MRLDPACGVGLLHRRSPFALFPFYWMVTTSLKSQTDLLASPPVWVLPADLGNYTGDLRARRDDRLLNSLIVATSTTALSVAARHARRVRARALRVPRQGRPLVLVHLEPDGQSRSCSRCPFYLIAAKSGLVDTHIVLILMYLTFTLPIVVWICTDQFRSIPANSRSRRDWKERRQLAYFLAYLPAARPARRRRVGDLRVHLFVERAALCARAHAQPDLKRRRWSRPISCPATNCRGERSWRPVR